MIPIFQKVQFNLNSFILALILTNELEKYQDSIKVFE